MILQRSIKVTVSKTDINNCFIIELNEQKDSRGKFVKTYNTTAFSDAGISFSSAEEYYSVSNKNVLRGLHVQIPPHDHDKIVYCITGHIMDVVIDIRKDSSTYLKFLTIELSGDDKKMVFLPKGCAHGFYSYEDNTIVMYKVTSEYSPLHDKGILWDSFDIPWPSKEGLIISDRDLSFPAFSQFDNPF